MIIVARPSKTRSSRADCGEPVDTQVHRDLDDTHKTALEACISDLAPGPICSNIFEDFLLEFNKEFGTTVLIRK